MSQQPILQFVQLTPPGRGAVATLLVEGPAAIEAVAAHFRTAGGRELRQLPPDRVTLGRFGPEPAEEVVLRRRAAGAVELNCHGGLAAVERIGRLLTEQGCREVPWRQWVGHCEQDPLAAEARLALADAPTERTGAILLDQYHGALGREIEAIRDGLAAGQIEDSRRRLDRLLGRAALGRHLIRPWRVVLAGQPNVGKSSLINALLGFGRAIVHHAPGTTRDVVTARTAMHGWPVELADTAGLRHSDDPLEQAGIQRAQEQLAAADLVLVVADTSRPWSEPDATTLAAHPRAILIHSKSDLPPADGPPRPEGLPSSARTGQGVSELVDAVSAALVPEAPAPGEALPWTEHQFDHLAAAHQAISEGNSVAARAALARLLAR